MADLTFDDLIPTPKKAPAVSFDDLIPDQAATRDGATVQPARVTVVEPSRTSPSPGVEAASTGDGSAAVGRGIVNGVPVVGPYLLGGLNRVAAGVRALKNDTRFSDELANVERFGERTAAEHPVASTAGELGGGVLGTLPAVAAAPAAFGIGAGGLAARSAASALTGAAIGGADAAVRSDGDPGATKTSAAIGGALGAVSPGIGSLVGRMVGARAANRSGQALVHEALDGVSEEDLAAAQRLMEQSRALPENGVGLTLDEALGRVTDGRTGRLSQVARVVANSGGEGGRIMNDFYAARPGEVERAGRAAFDAITPPIEAPSTLGPDVQVAARSGVAETPEGQALAAAQAAAGPRTTPLQAGSIVQPELRGLVDRLEQARDRQAAVDYSAARAAPDRVGIDRTVSVERPGEPIVTPSQGPPSFTPEAPAPAEAFAAAAPAAQGPQPGETLARYIARNGGIAPTPDLIAAGLHEFTVPGAGRVVREGGKPLDGFWRQDLRDAGYYRPDADGYATSDITNDLIRSLQNEQRGGAQVGRRPVNQQAAPQAQTAGAARDEFENALGLAQARAAADLQSVGVDPNSLHPAVRDRVVGALMRGEHHNGADALEAVVRGMREPPAPTITPTTVTEQVSAPRFGQVNPQPALDALDAQLRTAKGDVRSALQGTRRDAFEGTPDPASGERGLDLTVEGNLHWRERLDQALAQAVRDGDGTKVRDLQIVRSALDDQLKAVPEVATADANFAANSRPLEPFRGNTPLGRVVQRDDLTGRTATPAEQVPGLLSSPSAAREFAAIAPPAARDAMSRRLTTQILDGVTDPQGMVDAGRLRGAMREHEDVLGAFPDAAQRLGAVAAAREGLSRVEATPLGRLATQTQTGRDAIRVLFPTNPDPHSAQEVAQAVSALARQNPQVARHLVRQHVESVFNEATQSLKGGPAQYGGAGFASAVRGNPQQAQNLEAAVRALPNGDVAWGGLDKLLTTLEATGYRPQKGSDTYFNRVIGERLKEGHGPIGKAVTDVATGAAAGASVGGLTGALGGAVVGARRAAGDLMTRARMLGSTEGIARILTDPAALPDLRALARAPAGSKNAELFATRLLTLANEGTSALRAPRAASAR
ncbi:hypothetical protein [Methylobacterium sp. JK268]